MSVLRVAWGSRMGASLIGGMQEKLDALSAEGKVDILLNTNVDNLTLADGIVTGIKAVQVRGNTVVVTAKATILAAGGYEANQEKLDAIFENVA